jgi:hypothetical protein
MIAYAAGFIIPHGLYKAINQQQSNYELPNLLHPIDKDKQT